MIFPAGSTTGLAIGYAGDPHHIPEAYAERDARPRERKPVAEFLLGSGLWPGVTVRNISGSE